MAPDAPFTSEHLNELVTPVQQPYLTCHGYRATCGGGPSIHAFPPHNPNARHREPERVRYLISILARKLKELSQRKVPRKCTGDNLIKDLIWGFRLINTDRET